MEQEKTIRWTAKNIIIGKLLQLIWVSCALFYALYKLCDFILSPILAVVLEVNAYYTAANVCILLCLAVGILLSILMLKIFYNKKTASMDSETATVYFAKESKFKWHKLFSLMIGALILAAVLWLYVSISMRILLSDDSNIPQSLIMVALLVGLILAFIGISRGTKALNRRMVEVTGTNAELIAEVRSGLHNDLLPADMRQGEAFEGILSVLESAEAYSVRSAVVVYTVHVYMKKALRFLGKVLGISALIGIALGIHTGEKIDAFTKDMSACMHTANNASAKEAEAARQAWDAKEANQKKKWFEANQAKKKAQFDVEQAYKATAYNPNSYDAYRKSNIAQQSCWDWEKADKDKYL